MGGKRRGPSIPRKLPSPPPHRSRVPLWTTRKAQPKAPRPISSLTCGAGPEERGKREEGGGGAEEARAEDFRGGPPAPRLPKVGPLPLGRGRWWDAGPHLVLGHGVGCRSARHGGGRGPGRGQGGGQSTGAGVPRRGFPLFSVEGLGPRRRRRPKLGGWGSSPTGGVRGWGRAPPLLSQECGEGTEGRGNVSI